MKRTQRNWWDQRAIKNQTFFANLDPLVGMMRRYIPAERPVRTKAPTFRTAAFGGSARRITPWKPLVGLAA